MEKEVVLKKQEEVNELSAKLSEAKTVVAFDYHGLTVEQFTELRRNLRKAGCEAKVYKNNIARRAAEKAGYKDLTQYLVGPKAIAYSATDVVAPAKIVYEFAQKNEIVKIFAGIVEGEVSDAAKINALATLPSRETLLTMLASGMLSTVKDLAIGLNMYVEEKESAQA